MTKKELEKKDEEISIQFSGGCDSTLAAAIACKQFKKVHLLTFYHSAMSKVNKSKINVEKLKNKFGEDKICHNSIDIDKLWKRIYYENYMHDLITYRTYMCVFACTACQLSMHICMILYNIKKNIRFTWDGQQKEKGIWPEQIEKVIRLIKDFYKKFNILYENPVYLMKRTDWELYKLGIISEKNAKIEGITSNKNIKSPWKYYITHDSQSHCTNGHIGNLYLVGYYLPTHGQDASEKIAMKYYKEKIDFCTKIVSSLDIYEDKLIINKIRTMPKKNYRREII